MTTLARSTTPRGETLTGLARLREAVGRGAVISPRFDLSFFVLPPLGTAAFLAAGALLPEAAFALAAVVWVGLAQSHFGATALFFLDPRSREHYRQDALVYIAVPALLLAGCTAIGFTRFASAALLAVPIASFWHGNKQSVGVAGLYRGLTRSFDAASRRLEFAAIFAGSACFTAVGVVRFGLFEALGLQHTTPPAWMTTLWWAALSLATVLLLAAEARAYRQCRALGVPPGLRMSVLLTSFAMYLPYVLAHDPLSAYLAALIPHYLQYHGLLYLVNRNKIDARDVPETALLGALVRSPLAYAASTVGFALVLGTILAATHLAERVEIGLSIVAGVNLAHFWLDGFFWRFRDPRARAATLGYIRPFTNRAAPRAT